MSTKLSGSDYWAAFISNVASPPVWLLATAVLATLSVNLPEAWLYLLLYVLPIVLLATLYILLLWQKGIITDLHLRRREERVRPMIAIALATLLSTLVFFFTPAPRFLVLVALAVMFQLVCVALLTTFWKVSLHTTTATACVIMAYWFDPLVCLLLVPVLTAVIWARLHLRYHTPGQIVGGMALAAGTIGVALLFFGELWQ